MSKRKILETAQCKLHIFLLSHKKLFYTYFFVDSLRKKNKKWKKKYRSFFYRYVRV